jgi:hypothetical protein
VTHPSVHLRGVSERDIDLLLVEELAASAEFRSWFAACVGVAPDDLLEKVARSVISSTGESDLELVFRGPDGTTKVLVENKIYAVLQPRQSERYAERGAAYVEARSCDRILTVLVAPDAYSQGLEGFDARLSYEAIREWFDNRSAADARAKYKLHLLEVAIERGASGWSLVPSMSATDFWMRYWRLASEVAPQLQMPVPSIKPATSGFIRFRPIALGAGVELLHKVPYGNVDLQFAGMATRAAQFAAEYSDMLGAGMQIAPANKSLVVRISVSPAAVEAPFESSETAVRAALRAATSLLEWYERHVARSRAT